MAAAKRDKQQYLCILVNIVVTIKVCRNLMTCRHHQIHLDLKTVILITYEDDVLY